MNGYRHNKPSHPSPPADGSQLSTLNPQLSALNSQPSTLNPRSGFTLIELMVVVVIIAVLVGLLLPAIFGAMSTARVAEVRTEISQLDSAVTAFKASYGGIAPPSQITLYANESGYNGDPRSKAIIRSIWPQFDFSTNGGGGTTLTGKLNGAECLVFFLGGVRDGAGGPLIGFSKNPALPFATGGSRVGPFFEFDMARVKNTGGIASAPEYLDPLPSQTIPYVYYSSYGGKGYRSADVISPMPSFYSLPGGTIEYKQSSHQIISPGADGEYGLGGEYNGEDFEILTGNEFDRDNITNFTSGQLVP